MELGRNQKLTGAVKPALRKTWKELIKSIQMITYIDPFPRPYSSYLQVYSSCSLHVFSWVVSQFFPSNPVCTPFLACLFPLPSFIRVSCSLPQLLPSFFHISSKSVLRYFKNDYKFKNQTNSIKPCKCFLLTFQML